MPAATRHDHHTAWSRRAAQALPQPSRAIVNARTGPLTLFLGLAFLYAAFTMLILHSGLLEHGGVPPAGASASLLQR